ncbi:Formyltetrahydrofolate deformylase [Hordeum vulgare]|nr:Formyltetrahydrofolate deformylase [Hordeum vulgare]
MKGEKKSRRRQARSSLANSVHVHGEARATKQQQSVEQVSRRDTLHSFVMKSENLEKQYLAETIKSYCELRVLPDEVMKAAVF